MWDAVEPYAGQLLREEGGNVVQTFAKQALAVAGVYARLPQRLDALTTRLEGGKLAVDSPALNQRMRRLERANRRIVSAVLFSGLLVGGLVARPEARVLGTVLKVASVPALLHALFGGMWGRRGRSD